MALAALLGASRYWHWYWEWYRRTLVIGQIDAKYPIIAGISALVLGVGALYLRADEPQPKEPGLARLDALVIAWVAGMFVAGLWNQVPPATLAVGLWPYLLFALAYFGVRGAGVDPRSAGVMSAVAVVVLASTVVADALGHWKGAAQRPGGILGSRTYAAEYMAFALPAAIALRARIAHALGRIAWIAPLVVGVTLALTRSRTAWIAVALSMIALVVVSARAQRIAVAVGLGVLLVGGAIGALLPTTLKWKDENPMLATAQHLVDFESGSGAMRKAQHAEAWQVVGPQPVFGLGPAMWRKAMMDAQIDRKHFINVYPNSDYLHAFTDGGIVGLALFLAISAAIALQAFKARAVAPEALATWIAVAVVGAADFALARPESLWVALVGVSSALGRAKPVDIPA